MEPDNKILLSEEKETLFITLRAKALDSRLAHSILHDDKADEIHKSIDYDFNKYGKNNDNLMVVRARQYDEWIKEYLEANQYASVVYIGCGLDTRIDRIKPPASVNWFDLDFPEVIDVRKHFYSDKAGYRMIESSAKEESWFNQIPDNCPVLVIAEGVLVYFTYDEVKVLFQRILDHFTHGEIIFDTINTFARDYGKEELKARTGAEYKWAVDDDAEIRAISPRLQKITELPLLKSEFIRGLPLHNRLIHRFWSLFPQYKNMIGLMRYQF